MKRSHWVLSLSLWISAAVVSAQPTPPPPPAPPAPAQLRSAPATDDNRIAADIKRQLEADREVLSPLVDVSVDGGEVTLSGSTSTLLAKERAVTLAQKVNGVRRVNDEITVQPHLVFLDSTLRQQVIDALRAQEGLPAFDVIVRDSFVVLRGTVQTEDQRKLAETIVKSLVGVKGLENEIALKPQAR